MDTFWVVTLFHFQALRNQWDLIQSEASNFGAMGIEEYSLNEPEVDEILGDRSYSGGDLPLEVLEEVESMVQGRPGNYRFFFSTQEQALAFQEKASEWLTESQIEEYANQDWNAEWKKHYQPIQVNSILEIVPAWMDTHIPMATNHLLINPGMGFGTGSHETTFLCLKIFSEELAEEKLFHALDFGSGSGILGLAVLKLFSEAEVDFYDIDPEANKNCYQNAEINGMVAAKFRLLLPEVRDRLLPEYDLVFANILESILMEERSSLVSLTRPGGHLILSGLLNHQVQSVEEAFKERGMELLKRLDKGDWSAMLLRRKK